MKARLSVCALVVAAGFASVGAAPAAADQSAPPTCAATAQNPNTTTQPSPGDPCWVDVAPYPFGVDGNPVTSTTCPPQIAGRGVNPGCYLTVNSMAFRAWNRGIASLSAAGGNTPYGVWLYNGTRWYPDPTFPGTARCKGNTVLWAGKLDYWLVGDATLTTSPSYWPALCRFDRVAFQWEPISIPKSALAQVPLNPVTGTIMPGAITSGACEAWNNCWFFGTYGIVLHWDGQTLSDSANGLLGTPWLQADYTSAAAATSAAGNPFVLAVAASTSGGYASPATSAGFANASSVQVQAQPDGAPAPQVFGSAGAGVAQLAYSAPAATSPFTPFPLDLNAVDFNSTGQGWVAADPTGVRAGVNGQSASATHAAPLFPLSSSGTDESAACPGTPADSFPSSSFGWSSIGVLPNGDAIAGGQLTGSSGQEPVLAHVSCTPGSTPGLTEFRVPDPTASDPENSPLVPADGNGGMITAVAVTNASNQAWAATNATTIGPDNDVHQPPHLYELTDGQIPDAPAGDDVEKRPNTLQQSPAIYLPSPPVTVSPPPKAKTKYKHRKGKQVKLPSPIYDVHVSSLIPTGTGSFNLDITFKVRRVVKLGAEALHGKRVVSSSGMKTFRRGSHGVLVLHLSTASWPTKLKFVLPKATKK